MSIASEITRIQNAKASLKASINAKSTTQITNETLEDYASFVDNIPSGGGDISDYFKTSALNGSVTPARIIKKIPIIDCTGDTSMSFSEAVNLEEVSGFTNTSSLTTAISMFNSCSKLTTTPFFETPNITDTSYMFYGCSELQEIPQYNTSNVTNMSSMFYKCTKLKNVPILNTTKVTNMGDMFRYCDNITDNSMNNILQMCINATSYATTKTLYRLGFRSSSFSKSRIEALSNYQAFIDAGWTIGY